MGDQSIFRFLLSRQFAAAWLFVRHRDRHTIEPKPDKAQVLQQFTAFGQRIGRLIGNRLVVGAALVRITFFLPL